MIRIFSVFWGLFLAFALTSCAGEIMPELSKSAQAKVISAPVSRVQNSNSVSPASLPPICNCVLRFDRIGIEQGLSQSSVNVIFQDSRGFLWLGTQDGLNRYDGYNFKVYKPDPDAPYSLSDRWITSIVEDKQGYLWIGTRLGGLNRYDPRTEEFVHFVHSDKDPVSLSDNHINVLYIDQEDHFWVGTTKGLDLFEPNNNSFTHYTPPQKDGSAVKNITAIYQDHLKRIWVGTTAGGISRLYPRNRMFVTYQSNPDNPNSISYSHVTTIAEDKNNVLWVGTKSGLNRFEPDTIQFDRFLHSEGDPASIANNVINALYVDNTGNLWVGTSNGLDRLSAGGAGFI